MARYGAQSSGVEGSDHPANGRLDSWKEIAAYLGRGVRTVQRWERDEGLPVHRLAHEKRGTVYAYRHELDAWWQSRGSTLSANDAESESGIGAGAARNQGRVEEAPGRYRTQKHWLMAGGAAMAAVLLVTVLWLRADEPNQPLTLQRVTTTTARTVQATLSPDGKMVAYVSDGGRDGAPGQIWVQQIGSPTAIQLTHDAARHSLPSFSADGTRILFSRVTAHERGIYEVPALGGEAKLVLADVQRAVFSPDGKWIAYGAKSRLLLRAVNGTGTRDLSADLIAASQPVWSPDSSKLLVTARTHTDAEPEWWIVSLDGAPAVETGILRALRQNGFNEGWARTSPSWAADDQIVFSGRNRDGWSIWRQQLNTRTFEPDGVPQRLTTGTTVEWWPSVAAGRLAYVSSHADSNIWSLPADTNAGTVAGPLRRLTRGSGVTAYPSLSGDGRVLAFASDRTGDWDIYIKELTTAKEVVTAGGPERQMYAALSSDGSRLAFGVVTGESEVTRPVFVATVPDGRIQKLCDDCNGRPRGWLPGDRHLVLERFARVNSVAVLDTTTGHQVDLLVSPHRSVSNPRVSTDGRWIAFEASERRLAPTTYVARLNGGVASIPESAWTQVDHDAGLPFWSPDGRLLYYVTGTTVAAQMIRARRFEPETGQFRGEPFDIYSLDTASVPAFLTSGAALVATADQIILTLAEFRGDVWATSVR